MYLRIVLLLIISHLIGDFILQNQYIINMRFSKSFKYSIVGNLMHSSVHLCVMSFIYIIYCSLYEPLKHDYIYYYKIFAYITFLHFIIDEVKSSIVRIKPSFENSTVLFIIDQLVHIYIIILLIFNSNLKYVLNLLYNSMENYPYNISILDRWLIVGIIFLSCTFGAGVFIRKYIQAINLKVYKKLIDKKFVIVKPSKEVDIGSPNGGFIIGMLERVFILLVMAIGQPSMAGFVLTAKSIARFKKMDDSGFAEYFIIGTFISFIFAIFGGIIIKTLQVIPVIK